MPEQQIRFADGAAYERLMGAWSRLAGEVFLDWVAPPPGLRWIDIGCGNGAFTELICKRAAPREIHGIDPSESQLAFARARPTTCNATFQIGDAMALPFPADRFDAAVMALVIFFVSDPAKAVGEMARVVGPGGIVAAYAWDQTVGGSPLAPLNTAFSAMGYPPRRPPSDDASSIAGLRELWSTAGLEAVETREIRVSRTFAGLDEFWDAGVASPIIAPILARITGQEAARVKAHLRAMLPTDAAGRLTCTGLANAITGRVPR